MVATTHTKVRGREALAGKSFATYTRALPFESNVQTLLEDHRLLHARFNEMVRRGVRSIGGWTLSQIQFAHDRVVQRLTQLDPTFRHDSPMDLAAVSGQFSGADGGRQRVAINSSGETVNTTQTQLPALTAGERAARKHCGSCNKTRSASRIAQLNTDNLNKHQALESVRAMHWPSLTHIRPDLNRVARMTDAEPKGDAAVNAPDIAQPNALPNTQPLPPGMMDEDTLKAAFGQVLNLDPSDPMLDEIVVAVIDILEAHQATPMSEGDVEVSEAPAPVDDAAQEAVGPLSGRLMHLVGGKDFNNRATVLESELQRARLPRPLEDSVRRRFARKRATRESVRSVINEYQHLTRDLIHTSTPATHHHTARATADALSVSEQAFVQKVATLMQGE